MDSVCPHLGVPGDKELRYGYPTDLNVCYADQPGWGKFRPVEKSHQRQFCLAGDQILCPVYLRQLATPERGKQRKQAKTYCEFFGLRREPFSIVPHSHFLCKSQSQAQAHRGLRWLIDNHQGLGLLLGPVGTGKTLLCRALSDELGLDPQFVTALLLTPSHRSEYALMTDLLAGWQVSPQRHRSLRDLEVAAHQFLAQTVLDRRQTAVLILDEAQTLSVKQLQQVCKLLNWQDGGEQLLQVILAGQPDLRSKLARVPALRDRVVVDATLTAMTVTDVQRMIIERLRRAGRRGDLFAPSAVQLIHQHTDGMPRRVTVLCLLSMWSAYQDGKRYISGDVMRGIIERNREGGLFARAVPRAQPPRLLHRLWLRVGGNRQV